MSDEPDELAMSEIVSTGSAHRSRMELIAAIVIGLAAVLTAIASYQGAQIEG